MEKLTGKSQQVQGIPIEKENEGNILRNDANATVFQHNISFHLLGKPFHRSPEPNQLPPLIELQDQYYFSTGPEIIFEVKPTPKETEKRSMIETKMDEQEDCLGIDLNLKLSPPSSNSWISSPSSPQGAHLSNSLVDSDENLSAISEEDELPPLIVMGCTKCYKYMMLSKDDPKCLICKNRVLIDKFE